VKDNAVSPASQRDAVLRWVIQPGLAKAADNPSLGEQHRVRRNIQRDQTSPHLTSK
jgi:hypothetical protein